VCNISGQKTNKKDAMTDQSITRRNIGVLTAAQALGGASAPIVMSLGGLVGQQLESQHAAHGDTHQGARRDVHGADEVGHVGGQFGHAHRRPQRLTLAVAAHVQGEHLAVLRQVFDLRLPVEQRGTQAVQQQHRAAAPLADIGETAIGQVQIIHESYSLHY
jgi:hypothetical protein